MPRLPYADADQLGEMLRQSHFSEDTPPGNVFRMLAQAPPVGAAALGLIYAVLSEADLDPRVREIVILRVAERSAAPYAFAQHAAIAASVGVAAAQVAELERGRPPSELFDERERAALAFVDQVLRAARLRRNIRSARPAPPGSPDRRAVADRRVLSDDEPPRDRLRARARARVRGRGPAKSAQGCASNLTQHQSRVGRDR